MGEVMTEAQAAEWLGMTLSALRNQRMRGSGPPYFRMGRLVRYRLSTVNEWIKQQEQETAA